MILGIILAAIGAFVGIFISRFSDYIGGVSGMIIASAPVWMMAAGVIAGVIITYK